jgi:hypothetical protein
MIVEYATVSGITIEPLPEADPLALTDASVNIISSSALRSLDQLTEKPHAKVL